MIVENGMTTKQKNVFTEMIYKQEAVIACDFTKIEKVKKKVALLQKI